MSKKEPKCDNLPKHQRKIVLCLAKEGPMIIRETNTKIKGEYTSTNRAFHELETKGLIQRVSVKQYRKREFPRFWLTEKGIGYAISHDVKTTLLLENVKAVYPGDDEKASLVEVLSGFDEDLRKIMVDLIMREPKIGAKETVALTMLGISRGLDAKTVNAKMISVLKKYPKEYQFYRKGLRRSVKQLRQLITTMEGVES